MICQRCAKDKTAIHTCTPSALVRKLEQQRDELVTFAQRIAALPPHGEYVALIDEARAAIAKATGGQP